MNEISQEVKDFKDHYIEYCTHKNINEIRFLKYFNTILSCELFIGYYLFVSISGNERFNTGEKIYINFFIIVICIIIFSELFDSRKIIIKKESVGTDFQYNDHEKEKQVFTMQIEALLTVYNLKNNEEKQLRFISEMECKCKKAVKVFNKADFVTLGLIVPFWIKVVDWLYTNLRAETNADGFNKFICFGLTMLILVTVVYFVVLKLFIPSCLTLNYHSEINQYRRLKDDLYAVYKKNIDMKTRTSYEKELKLLQTKGQGK